MIAVTGLMRSGTSPLAMMLHQMGVTMGTHMRFPPHNEFAHFEWEDAAITEALASVVIKQQDPDFARQVIDQYVRARKRLSKGKPWGFKTPFMMPFVRHLQDVCEEIGEPLVLIMAEREYSDTVGSVRRQMSHMSVFERGGILRKVLGAQKALLEHVDSVSECAEIFPLSDTLGFPEKVAERLAKLAGVKCNLEIATRGIRKEQPQWELV